MGRRAYPGEFRRRVLDLHAAGRKVADLARDLGVRCGCRDRRVMTLRHMLGSAAR